MTSPPTQQFPVQQVILFGSKARGDDDEYSDIDLLLITQHKPHWKKKRAMVDLFFDVGMKYDVLFSRTGQIDVSWGKHYDWLFDNRHEADYSSLVSF